MHDLKLPRFWVLVAALVPLYLTWTFDHSLWNPDETRDAGIAREMYVSGDYAVPTLNGEPFLEKPPLYYWTSAAVYTLTGRITAGTTRLPAVLYGMLGVLFTFLIGKLLFNERTGFFAACMLATSAQYFRMSHFAVMDVALAALVAGAFYFHLKGSRIGFIAFTVLAFYAKGFLGVVLTGFVVIPHMLLEKKPKELLITIGFGAVVFALTVFPWFFRLWQEGGTRFLEIFFIDNHWVRFFSESADHTEHFWFFYLMTFPVDFLPWTIAFSGAMWDFYRDPQKYIGSKSLRFALLWFFGLLLFFTVSSSKRSIYLLPVFPSAALLSANWLDEIMVSRADGARWERRIHWIFGFIALMIAAAGFLLAPKLDRDKTFVPLCEVARAEKGEGGVVGYNMSEMERGVFGFYLEGPLKNPTDARQLQELIDKMGNKSFCLIVNRNKIGEVATVLEKKMKLIFEYRPNKKTRSYLVYATRSHLN